MKTCNTTEGSAQQPGKPGICELTEFKTNSKIHQSIVADCGAGPFSIGSKLWLRIPALGVRVAFIIFFLLNFYMSQNKPYMLIFC